MQQKKWGETINSSYANHHKWLLDNGVNGIFEFLCSISYVNLVNVSRAEFTVSINHQLF